MIISISGIDAQTARKLERQWQSELDARVPLLVLDTAEVVYAGPNRQRGADLTRSEVVSFFDVDDVQAPERLEIIADAFTNGAVKAAFHRFTIQNREDYPEVDQDAWFDGAPNMYHRGWISVRRDVIRSVAWGNQTCHCGSNQRTHHCQTICESNAFRSFTSCTAAAYSVSFLSIALVLNSTYCFCCS